jgi:hypothetical protein
VDVARATWLTCVFPLPRHGFLSFSADYSTPTVVELNLM